MSSPSSIPDALMLSTAGWWISGAIGFRPPAPNATHRCWCWDGLDAAAVSARSIPHPKRRNARWLLPYRQSSRQGRITRAHRGQHKPLGTVVSNWAFTRSSLPFANNEAGRCRCAAAQLPFARGSRHRLSAFFERIQGSPVDSLKASWLIYGEDSVKVARRATKRAFDVLAAAVRLF